MNLKSLFYYTTSLFDKSYDSIGKRTLISPIFPFYHTVSNEILPHCKHLFLVKSVQDFEQDLDFFLQHYTPIALPDLIDAVQHDNEITKPSFSLSFDDGLSQIYDTIAPILRKKGVPAIFFLNNDFLDNHHLFYRSKISLLIDAFQQKKISKNEEKELISRLRKENTAYSSLYDLLDLHFYNDILLEELAQLLGVDFDEYLKQVQPYLSTQQVHSLIEQGFYIGSHSASHRLYFTISETQQINETIEGISFIQKQFNLPYRLFAFPFTDEKLSYRFFEQIAPYVDLTFGTAGMKKDTISTNIQRIGMEVKGMNAAQIINAEVLYYQLKKRFDKNIIRR